MNERIKELIAQAREPLHNRDLPFNQGLMEYSEKFAELIVRKCLGIIDEEGSHEGGSIRSMEVIKQRFGVEE